jgi:hypothetical protein
MTRRRSNYRRRLDREAAQREDELKRLGRAPTMAESIRAAADRLEQLAREKGSTKT